MIIERTEGLPGGIRRARRHFRGAFGRFISSGRIPVIAAEINDQDGPIELPQSLDVFLCEVLKCPFYVTSAAITPDFAIIAAALEAPLQIPEAFFRAFGEFADNVEIKEEKAVEFDLQRGRYRMMTHLSSGTAFSRGGPIFPYVYRGMIHLIKTIDARADSRVITPFRTTFA